VVEKPSAEPKPIPRELTNVMTMLTAATVGRKSLNDDKGFQPSADKPPVDEVKPRESRNVMTMLTAAAARRCPSQPTLRLSTSRSLK